MAAVLTLDAEGVTIRSASQALSVLFGYADPEEFIGKPLSTLLSPPSFLGGYQRTRACSSSKLPCTSCVVVGWRKDGTALSLRLAISELKVGEDVLFCCLLEKRKDNSCLLTIDSTHCITACNKPAAELLGYQPRELVGVTVQNLFPGFPDTLRLRFLRAKERVKGKHRDGTQISVRMEVTERRLPTNACFYILNLNPIDEERDPFLLVSRAGRIVKANAAACQMFGYTESNLVGRSINKLMINPPSSMKELCNRCPRPTLSPLVAGRQPAASPGLLGTRSAANSPAESMRVIRARHRNGTNFYIFLEVNEVRENHETVFMVKLRKALHRRQDSSGSDILKDSRYVGHYILGETLADGLYGKVKAATHQLTNEKVVVKIIEREKVDIKRFREIELMRHLDHPHVVKMLEVIETPETQYLVLDMIEGGELYNHLIDKGHLSEDETRKFWRQLVSAVDYMHSKRIVHRDLKLENLMLDEDNNLVVIDFGLGNFMTPGKLMKTFCGSVAYAAPEMFLCQNYIGTAADIWSMGVILYCLVLGYLPFEDPRRVVQADYIPMNATFLTTADNPNPPPSVSLELVDLVDRIFQKDPTQRITMKEICEHPWTNKDLPPLPCLSASITEQQQTPEPLPQLPPQQVQPQQINTQQQQQFSNAQHAKQHPPHLPHIQHQDQRHGMGNIVEDIVRRSLEEYGFEKSVISKSIEAKEFNPITACHFLLTKRNRKNLSTVRPPTAHIHQDIFE